MKLAVTNPNLTVVMPVGCNASCKFCYWESNSGLTHSRFKFIADTLPNMFKQCSITGGEPTISNELMSYVEIANSRFDKVVLNTNGYRLTKDIIEAVDHVNISRHHYEDHKNEQVFGTNTVPSIETIREYCRYGDITLNCVLPDGFNNVSFVNNYISMGRDIVTGKQIGRAHV